MPRSIRPKPLGSPAEDVPEDVLSRAQAAIASPDTQLPRTKRQQTHIACNACRSARAKCDGKRPCSRCVARAVPECFFEVHEGETRMSSLRKKVSRLEDEVAFLKELIDTGWDTSQEHLRLRVRQGLSSSNYEDTPRTRSVTAMSDANAPEEGVESSARMQMVGAESSNIMAQRWLEGVSNNAESSSVDDRLLSRPQLDGHLPTRLNRTSYTSRESYTPSPHRLTDPFNHFSHRGRSPVLPPPSIDPLPQPFFEQLCVLLDTGHSFPSLASGFAERLDDHITLLAITKGWNEVIRTVSLDPQWQVLRQIDSYLHFMRPIDRLATLRMMRLQMKCYAASGSNEVDKAQALLPEWAKPTAIQMARNRPNVVRYVAWPMIRNHLLTHPALITASFFSCLLSCTRFIFPKALNPVLTTPMGMLELAPEFEHKLKDLNCWTMTREFTNRYPIFDRAVRIFEDEPAAKDSRVDGIMDGMDWDNHEDGDGHV